MGRKIKHNLVLKPVKEYQVAEHRYKWDDVAYEFFFTWREVRDNAPYKKGEVVYVVYGDGFRKAIIVSVGATKNAYDDWRECYKVLPETKSGQWSKLFYVAHPGFVQRGYKRAGLAPEMPDE